MGYEDTKPKTEPWDIEPVRVTHEDEKVIIVCGGGEMPQYNVTANSLGEAIQNFVHQITEDAIKDEAFRWSELSS